MTIDTIYACGVAVIAFIAFLMCLISYRNHNDPAAINYLFPFGLIIPTYLLFAFGNLDLTTRTIIGRGELTALILVVLLTRISFLHRGKHGH